MVCGLLTAGASLVLEHRLQSHGLQQLWQWGLSCPVGMWNPPGPGLELVSPALQADTYPLRHQGNPTLTFFNVIFLCFSSARPQNTQNNTILKPQLQEDTYPFQSWQVISGETNTVLFACLCMYIYLFYSVNLYQYIQKTVSVTGDAYGLVLQNFFQQS